MAYRVVLLCLFALAVAYTLGARQIALDPWSEAELINSRTLPTLYGVLLGVTLAIMLFHRAPWAGVPAAPGRAAALCVCLFVFSLLVSYIGIWLALGALLISAMWVMGERNLVPMIAVPVGLPVAGWLVIERLLGVFVPGPF